jgi:hypothetical protein
MLDLMENPCRRDEGRIGMKKQTDTGRSAATRHPEVVSWRREQLLAAGFGRQESDDLARNCAIDLHALIALVEQGCPPALARRIVAPLEHETRIC